MSETTDGNLHPIFGWDDFLQNGNFLGRFYGDADQSAIGAKELVDLFAHGLIIKQRLIHFIA